MLLLSMENAQVSCTALVENASQFKKDLYSHEKNNFAQSIELILSNLAAYIALYFCKSSQFEKCIPAQKQQWYSFHFHKI